MNVSIRWLWLAMSTRRIMLAGPGQSDPAHMLGDVVGHFFSALLLAIVPVIGYRLMYKRIGEKEITFIFSAAWAYLVLTQFFGG